MRCQYHNNLILIVFQFIEKRQLTLLKLRNMIMRFDIEVLRRFNHEYESEFLERIFRSIFAYTEAYKVEFKEVFCYTLQGIPDFERKML